MPCSSAQARAGAEGSTARTTRSRALSFSVATMILPHQPKPTTAQSISPSSGIGAMRRGRDCVALRSLAMAASCDAGCALPPRHANARPQQATEREAMAGDTHRTDVAVIGAGPVGLFAIFELGMLKMRCHVIDALDTLGGQCAALYPEKPIYDIPGYPRIGAVELVERLAEQAAPFHPVYHLAQQVERLAPLPAGGFRVETSLGTAIEARAVIIAAGVGAFGPNRPPLAGLERYEGQSVFYFVKRREDFRGKRVVIAGGGDSAVDWALSLAEVAA